MAAPQPFYNMREWVTLTGLATRRLRRAFLRHGIISSSANGVDGSRSRRPHHVIALETVKAKWPELWREVRRRVAQLIEHAEADVRPAV